MAHRKLSPFNVLFVLIFLAFLSIFSGCKSDYAEKYQFSLESDIYEVEDDLVSNIDKANYIPKRWKYVIIHCTANFHPISKEALLRIFKSYGWSKPGYNLFVNRDGKIDTLVHFNKDRFISANEIANGAKGYNSEAIHISYDGGVDRQLRPKDTRTYSQKIAIIEILSDILEYNPQVIIIGHNNVSNKACPSFDAVKEYSYLKN
jgi:N-acetyl-anhydromuramyl-L-alanine amidase AmpD